MTMRVRFWGTRGSIPVALTAADVRDKLAQALVQASGKTFNSYEEAHAYALQIVCPLRVISGHFVARAMSALSPKADIIAHGCQF